MNQATLLDVTCPDYSIQRPSSGSSTEKIKFPEELDWLFYTWTRQQQSKRIYFYPSSLLYVGVYLSSMQLVSGIPNLLFFPEEIEEKTFDKEIPENKIAMEMMEHDLVIRMAPKKKYAIELEITNIRKGKPRFVEPDQI